MARAGKSWLVDTRVPIQVRCLLKKLANTFSDAVQSSTKQPPSLRFCKSLEILPSPQASPGRKGQSSLPIPTQTFGCGLAGGVTNPSGLVNHRQIGQYWKATVLSPNVLGPSLSLTREGLGLRRFLALHFCPGPFI